MKHTDVTNWDDSYSVSQNRPATAGLEPPAVVHVLIGACLVLMTTMNRWWYDSYERISREDHLVEWATVVFYLAAAYIGLKYGFSNRRLLDTLVGIYCLVNAGEEFSWGQRLLGFEPPKFFLAENVQQEINIHNFFSSAAHDLVFALLVAAYFVLLPLLARWQRTAPLLNTLGGSAPPIQFAAWAFFLAVLHTWHPFQLATEWHEAILGGLFLLSALVINGTRLSSFSIATGFAASLVLSLGLTKISDAHEQRYVAINTACARTELQNLLTDIIEGDAATPLLRQGAASGHRRVFLAEERGLLKSEGLRRFMTTNCDLNESDAELRRRFAIDPWGLSYWILVTDTSDGSRMITVYSFGPNRRRDSNDQMGNAGIGSNDDMVERANIQPLGARELNKPNPQVFSIEGSK